MSRLTFPGLPQPPFLLVLLYLDTPSTRPSTPPPTPSLPPPVMYPQQSSTHVLDLQQDNATQHDAGGQYTGIVRRIAPSNLEAVQQCPATCKKELHKARLYLHLQQEQHRARQTGHAFVASCSRRCIVHQPSTSGWWSACWSRWSASCLASLDKHLLLTETKTLYGKASPPTSYGGYGGNAKEDAKYAHVQLVIFSTLRLLLGFACRSFPPHESMSLHSMCARVILLPCRYTFQYPASWKNDVVNKVHWLSSGITTNIVMPKKHTVACADGEGHARH